MKPYELIEHTADVGIKIFGKDEKELFLNAAYAFFDLITDINVVEPRVSHSVALEGETLEELFFNWLDELLFLFDAKGFVGCEFEIEKWGPKRIQAKIKGETFNPDKHPLETAIKAVTYHNLKIHQKDNHWEAEVIFDI